MIKPILFNGEMVKAILDGRKTVTRRVVKNIYSRTDWMGNFVDGTTVGRKAGTTYSGFYKDSDIFYTDGIKRIDGVYSKLPYDVGDVLYVRETFWKGAPDGRTFDWVYKADDDEASGYIWSPSLHMPKSAARIFLKVTGVRVERLQGIRGCDIRAEGIDNTLADVLFYEWARKTDINIIYAIQEKKFEYAWRFLWDSTIKKTDIGKYGWNGNPWVWVYEFERCEKPEGFGV